MAEHLQLVATQSRRSAARDDRLIRVQVMDAHHRVRRSLSRLIESEHDLTVIAEVADLATALDALERYRPDVLVLDLPLPDRPSIGTVRSLRALVPGAEIVVITMEASAALAERALAAGALGFVLKERGDVDLPHAIRLAVAGVGHVSPPLDRAVSTIRRASTTIPAVPRNQP
jgi:DNA-binding NarL/FixJ family response regulator